MEPNFKECKSINEANQVDLNRYTFLERFSAERGLYVFKLRAKYAK